MHFVVRRCLLALVVGIVAIYAPLLSVCFNHLVPCSRTDLSAGHSQQEHETSHGSMSKTRWVVDDPDGTGLQIEGHKFSSNDDGGAMLCNLVCKSMGRHVHVGTCRGSYCHDSQTQHITKKISPNPDQAKDWITHKLYWQLMGGLVT